MHHVCILLLSAVEFMLIQLFEFRADRALRQYGFTVRGRLNVWPQCRRSFRIRGQEAALPRFAPVGLAAQEGQAGEKVQFPSERCKGAVFQQGWVGYQEAASESNRRAIVHRPLRPFSL